MHTVDPAAFQGVVMQWIGVLGAIAGALIALYFSLKNQWQTAQNKERLDSHAQKIDTLMLAATPGQGVGSTTVNAPSPGSVVVNEAAAPQNAPQDALGATESGASPAPPQSPAPAFDPNKSILPGDWAATPDPAADETPATGGTISHV